MAEKIDKRPPRRSIFSKQFSKRLIIDYPKLPVGSFFDEGETGRKLLSIGLLIFYSLIGAAIYYQLEKDNDGAHPRCMPVDFWEALYFCNTVHSTIGYGNSAPCTVGGKVFTCFYVILGTPIFIFAIGSVGELMALVLAWVFFKIKEFYKEGETKLPVTEKSKRLSVIAGVIILIAWMLISAFYFFLVAESSDTIFGTYLEWLYFMVISVTTVGLGDVAPFKFELTILHFTFITIGLALFSMVVGTVEEQIGDLSDKAIVKLRTDFTHAVESGEITPSNDPKIAWRQIERFLYSVPGGRLLEKFMSKKDKERLLDVYNTRANMRLIGTNTDPVILVDAEIECDVRADESRSMATQTDESSMLNASSNPKAAKLRALVKDQQAKETIEQGTRSRSTDASPTTAQQRRPRSGYFSRYGF